MALGLLGTKVGMTQIYDASGARVPVTVVQAGPCVVLEKKTPEKHRYAALRVAYGEISPFRLNKPDLGQFKSRDAEPKRHIREFRVTPAELAKYEPGQALTVELFAAGQNIDVTGTSKGKGYQGVMKRHHFKGSTPSTRGTHEYQRHGGSIGNREWPGHVFKGRGMAGQMGDETVTTQNLVIQKVDAENGVLLISGAVPGARGGLLVLKPSVKKLRAAKQPQAQTAAAKGTTKATKGKK